MAEVTFKGGPYDGASFDAADVFPRPLPRSLVIGPTAELRRYALYELAPDARCYLFRGWDAPPASPPPPPHHGPLP